MSKLKILKFTSAIARCSGARKMHLLLGNGFSRAWNDHAFSYDALLNKADFSGLSREAREVFEVLKTSDFESVMRALRNAAEVIHLYEPSNDSLKRKLISDANKLRDILVKAIAGNHPDRPNAISTKDYEHAKRFLSHFGDIYTLNYDLLLYWSLMQMETKPRIEFDDGFRTPEEGKADYVTWEIDKSDKQNIFYLHGALHIFDGGYETQKYTWINTGIPLIEQIREALDKDLYPIFVSEAESRQKLSKIKHSDLLSRALRSFAKIGGTLFIFGHSMSPNDEHIIRLIGRNKVDRLFVGLFGNPESRSNKRIIARSKKLIKERPSNKPLEVSFFNSDSVHVWR